MKTTDEILSEMAVVQAKFPVLDSLDSTSGVSFILNLKKFWALLVQMLFAEVEAAKLDIETIIQTASAGSLSWYVDQIKLYQHGDQVSILNGRVAYDVFDAQKQLIKQAACVEDLSTGRLSFKAAKLGEGGFVALDANELEAVKSYVGKIKFAGVVADVISIEADDLKLLATVKIDRQVLRADGALLTDATKFPVNEAIVAFIASLPYNSVLNNTELTDKIQSVKGVKDFSITGSFTRRPVSGTWVSYSREVVSQAGHMKLHNDSNINYTF
jgi:hypothetical protein